MPSASASHVPPTIARDGWVVNWNITETDGIRIYDVTYREILVLNDARVPGIRVTYFGSACFFYDELRSIWLLDSRIFLEDLPRGGFQIRADYDVPGYDYHQIWRFLPDGRLIGLIRVGGGGCFAPHLYTTRMRFDFAFAGQDSDTAGVFGEGNWRTIDNETMQVDDGNWDPASLYTKFRIMDGEIGYNFAPYETPDPPHNSTVMILRNHPDEIEPSHIAGREGPIVYLDNETVSGTDLVLWYISNHEHNPHLERVLIDPQFTGVVFYPSQALSRGVAAASPTPLVENQPPAQEPSITAAAPHDELLSFLPNHPPITIEGDAQFTPSNGVLSGRGSPEDPYVIWGWRIDASQGHGIHIRNTRAHFVVVDVTVGAGLRGGYDGILLENVANGRIEKTLTTANLHGIALVSSRDNRLVGNLARDNEMAGIGLYNSESNALIENEVSGSMNGIYLHQSRRNILAGNRVPDNMMEGIETWYSDENHLLENVAEKNPMSGIGIHFSSGNILEANRVGESSFGIELWGSHENRLRWNKATSSDAGIYLVYSNRNLVEGNSISRTSWVTIGQEESYENLLLQDAAVEAEAPSIPADYARTYQSPQWMGGGTRQPWVGDDEEWNYRLPFPFPFYGTTYTEIWITSNGLIAFEPGNSRLFRNSEEDLRSGKLIAPLWYDWIIQPRSADGIFVEQTDEGHVLVRWRVIPFTADGTVNFETVLGIDGVIRFDYGTAETSTPATIGISSGTGISALTETVSNISLSHTVVFTPASGPPLASYSFTPLNPVPLQTVTFDARSSTDPDGGSITTYRWDFGDGSLPVQETDSLTSHAFAGPGLFKVVLTVTDDEGVASAQRREVTVLADGRAPVARFTVEPSQLVRGGAVTVDASLSYDPDGGSMVAYDWSFGDGSVGSGSIGQHSYSAPGVYAITLTVRDDEGQTATADEGVHVTVVDVRLLEGGSQEALVRFREGATVNLNATALNIGNIPGLGYASFQVTVNVTGWVQTYYSSILTVDVRDFGYFSVNLPIVNLNTRYDVVATLYYSNAPLNPGDPGWFLGGNRSFSFNVTRMDDCIDGNCPPVLEPLPGRSVDEESSIVFGLRAFDLEHDPLSFGLAPGGPLGGSITPEGVFSWTPSEVQGPGNYTIEIIVSDGSLSDSQNLTVNVSEVNRAPQLLLPDIYIVADEETLLTFHVTGSDPDILEAEKRQTLTFSLAAGGPEGVSITPDGVFQWTPDETQGPGNFAVTIIVTDGSMLDSETVTITVNEVNRAPTLTVPGAQAVDEESLISFTVSALDPDIPSVLSLSASDLPVGAAFDRASGEFEWTPSETQGPGVYHVTFTATDQAGLSDTRTVSVTVSEVNAVPTTDFSVDRTETARTETVSFDASSTRDPDSTLLTYLWDFGDGYSGTGMTIKHSYGSMGSFTVMLTVSDDQGATSSGSKVMIVGNRTPDISLTIERETVNMGDDVTVLLTAVDLDGQVALIQVDWGDGAVENLEGSINRASHRYGDPGVYTVSVTVTDNNGGTDMNSVTLRVQAPFGFLLPLVGISVSIAVALAFVILRGAGLGRRTGGGNPGPHASEKDYFYGGRTHLPSPTV